MKLIITVLLNFAILTLSQAINSSIPEFPCLREIELDAIVPACARPCQQHALSQDGCENYNDVACHCSHTSAVAKVLVPCLLKNSSCGVNDTEALFHIVKPICTYFNMTTNGTLPKPNCESCLPTSIIIANNSTLSTPTPSISGYWNVTSSTQTASIVPYMGIGNAVSPGVGFNLLLGLVGLLAF